MGGGSVLNSGAMKLTLDPQTGAVIGATGTAVGIASDASSEGSGKQLVGAAALGEVVNAPGTVNAARCPCNPTSAITNTIACISIV